MSLSSDEVESYQRLADVLIPAGDGMPSASQADAGGQWLHKVLDVRPDLVNGLRGLLLRAADRKAHEFVGELQASEPAAFGILAEIVPAAYFMNPDVRQAIGYVGQAPLPIDPRPDYLEDGLLEQVIRRGRIYRPTPRHTEDVR
jgi:hypothetical protein